MSERLYIDVLVEENPGCPEGCTQRFKAEDEPRPVRGLRYWASRDESFECDLVGWRRGDDGAGVACPAFGVTVEDSGSGTAILIYGGDFGIRLLPRDGREAFGEPYLTVAREDILD